MSERSGEIFYKLIKKRAKSKMGDGIGKGF